MSRVRLIVRVMPPVATANSTDLEPNLHKPLRILAVPARTTDTFADVWKSIVERDQVTASEAGKHGIRYHKLQGSMGEDITLGDTLEDLGISTESPREDLILLMRQLLQQSSEAADAVLTPSTLARPAIGSNSHTSSRSETANSPAVVASHSSIEPIDQSGRKRPRESSSSGYQDKRRRVDNLVESTASASALAVLQDMRNTRSGNRDPHVKSSHMEHTYSRKSNTFETAQEKTTLAQASKRGRRLSSGQIHRFKQPASASRVQQNPVNEYDPIEDSQIVTTQRDSPVEDRVAIPSKRRNTSLVRTPGASPSAQRNRLSTTRQWSSVEDQQLLEGHRKGWKTHQSIKRFNMQCDSNEAEVRLRALCLKYPDGVVSTLQTPNPLLDHTVARLSPGTTGRLNWTAHEINTVARMIAQGNSAREICESSNLNRPAESIRMQVRRLQEQIIRQEKKLPGFPDDSYHVTGWTDKHSLHLRRAYNQGMSATLARKKFFRRFKEADVQRKLAGYREQLGRSRGIKEVSANGLEEFSSSVVNDLDSNYDIDSIGIAVESGVSDTTSEAQTYDESVSGYDVEALDTPSGPRLRDASPDRHSNIQAPPQLLTVIEEPKTGFVVIPQKELDSHLNQFKGIVEKDEQRILRAHHEPNQKKKVSRFTQTRLPTSGTFPRTPQRNIGTCSDIERGRTSVRHRVRATGNRDDRPDLQLTQELEQSLLFSSPAIVNLPGASASFLSMASVPSDAAVYVPKDYPAALSVVSDKESSEVQSQATEQCSSSELALSSRVDDRHSASPNSTSSKYPNTGRKLLTSSRKNLGSAESLLIPREHTHSIASIPQVKPLPNSNRTEDSHHEPLQTLTTSPGSVATSGHESENVPWLHASDTNLLKRQYTARRTENGRLPLINGSASKFMQVRKTMHERAVTKAQFEKPPAMSNETAHDDAILQKSVNSSERSAEMQSSQTPERSGSRGSTIVSDHDDSSGNAQATAEEPAAVIHDPVISETDTSCSATASTSPEAEPEVYGRMPSPLLGQTPERPKRLAVHKQRRSPTPATPKATVVLAPAWETPQVIGRSPKMVTLGRPGFEVQVQANHIWNQSEEQLYADAKRLARRPEHVSDCFTVLRLNAERAIAQAGADADEIIRLKAKERRQRHARRQRYRKAGSQTPVEAQFGEDKDGDSVDEEVDYANSSELGSGESSESDVSCIWAESSTRIVDTYRQSANGLGNPTKNSAHNPTVNRRLGCDEHQLDPPIVATDISEPPVTRSTSADDLHELGLDSTIHEESKAMETERPGIDGSTESDLESEVDENESNIDKLPNQVSKLSAETATAEASPNPSSTSDSESALSTTDSESDSSSSDREAESVEDTSNDHNRDAEHSVSTSQSAPLQENISEHASDLDPSDDDSIPGDESVRSADPVVPQDLNQNPPKEPALTSLEVSPNNDQRESQEFNDNTNSQEITEELSHKDSQSINDEFVDVPASSPLVWSQKSGSRPQGRMNAPIPMLKGSMSKSHSLGGRFRMDIPTAPKARHELAPTIKLPYGSEDEDSSSDSDSE